MNDTHTYIYTYIHTYIQQLAIPSTDSRILALEARVKELEAENEKLRNELGRK
jgi:hypothetical protein